MDDSFTLAEVARRTGAKRRSIQLWADAGVIQSSFSTDRAGTGTHRQFQPVEVQIAAIMVPLAQMHTPIGVLRTFANVLRYAAFRNTVGSLRNGPKLLSEMLAEVAEVSTAVRRAAAGTGRNFLLFAHDPDGVWLHVATDENGPISIDPARDFAELKNRERAAIIILDLTGLLAGLLV